MKPFSKTLIAITILLTPIAAGTGFAAYKYGQSKNVKSSLNSPDLDANKQLLAQINTIFDLPVGEDPTIATITDVSKLKDQDFFKSAQNQDKVLIFTKAKKAILYRPTSNKIIDVAPISISDSTPSGQIGQVAGAATGASFGIPTPPPASPSAAAKQ